MKENEDYALILSQKKTRNNINTANAVGTLRFTLLNLELEENIKLNPQEKILLAKNNEIKKIYRLNYDNLSNDERKELTKAVHNIIIRNEPQYVDFFNRQSKDKMQLHFLEGISRKKGLKILLEKEKGDFKSFEDIEKRISFIDDVENLIAKRVLFELIELPKQKNKALYLFVNIKYRTKNKKEISKLDNFEKNDKYFLEMIQKEGLLEKSGKRIK